MSVPVCALMGTGRRQHLGGWSVSLGIGFGLPSVFVGPHSILGADSPQSSPFPGGRAQCCSPAGIWSPRDHSSPSLSPDSEFLVSAGLGFGGWQKEPPALSVGRAGDSHCSDICPLLLPC